MLADFAEAARKIHERGRILADVVRALGLGPTEHLRREHWQAVRLMFRMALEAYADVGAGLQGDLGEDDPA